MENSVPWTLRDTNLRQRTSNCLIASLPQLYNSAGEPGNDDAGLLLYITLFCNFAVSGAMGQMGQRRFCSSHCFLSLQGSTLFGLDGAYVPHDLGRSEVQVHAQTNAGRALAAVAVCAVAPAIWTRLNNGCRMTRERHVWFCFLARCIAPSRFALWSRQSCAMVTASRRQRAMYRRAGPPRLFPPAGGRRIEPFGADDRSHLTRRETARALLVVS